MAKWRLKDVSELGNLKIVSVRCWKFGILQFRLLEIIKSCQFVPSFPMFPGKRGDGGVSGKAIGSVPQHARFRILQTLALYVVRTQI